LSLSIGKLIVWLENIRQEWKIMTMANTLAYYTMAVIITMKSFMLQFLRA
jgi:hypothetical protein